MEAQQEENKWMFRIGGVAAVVGSLSGMVENIIHPATPDNDPVGAAQIIANSGMWASLHLAIIVALILMLVGLAAISRSIKGGLAGSLARLAYVMAIAGLSAGFTLIVLDGFALKHLAEAWAAAPLNEKATALQLTTAMETINLALLALFNILFAGATYILFGLAVAWSRLYPSWLGWIVVVAGVGSVIVGAIQATTGETSVVTQVLGIVFPTTIMLWTALMGVLLYRRASRGEVG